MNPLRKKRLLIIVAILAGVGIAVTLALSALQENINLFYTPTQIASGEAPHDTRIRAGGMVEKGSLQRSADSLDVTFVVTDFNKSVTITYRGILPDLFREGQGIVALGKLNAERFLSFYAIGFFHGRNIKPADLVPAVGNNFSAMIDVSVDPKNIGADKGGLINVHFRRIVRAQNSRL